MDGATVSAADAGLRRVAHIMGMPIGIDVRDPDVDPTALERAFDWLRWVDATFSTYKAESEISRLNRGELALADAHPDVRAVLARCEELRGETGGFFDVGAALLAQWERVGDVALRVGAVDPSGLVKGWAVERAARILDAAGARTYSINAGSDVRVRGRPEPAGCWRVGIQRPLQRGQVAAAIPATDLAIVTSGAYERGAHIVDPYTGRPPEGIVSVTVVGPDLATADAYATAAYAMGADGPAWTAGLAGTGYEALTILADETVLSTRGFPTA